MKITPLLFAILVACGFSSCATKVVTSPLPAAGAAPTSPVPVAASSSQSATTVKKTAVQPVAQTPPVSTGGAMKQVPNPPTPRAFPNIPLKEPSDTSPLIHSKPDQPSYQRSR